MPTHTSVSCTSFVENNEDTILKSSEEENLVEQAEVAYDHVFVSNSGKFAAEVVRLACSVVAQGFPLHFRHFMTTIFRELGYQFGKILDRVSVVSETGGVAASDGFNQQDFVLWMLHFV